MYYASTLHGESTIQRPIPGTTDYMQGVISNKWMKGKELFQWLIKCNNYKSNTGFFLKKNTRFYIEISQILKFYC